VDFALHGNYLGLATASRNKALNIRTAYVPETVKGRKCMNKTQWGRETEGLTISLSTEKAVFESNDTIGLNISLKNTGPTPTAIVVRSPWIDYDISVRDENNNELPKSAYAQQMRETAAEGLRRTQQLMPGEELTETLELDKAYDLKKPNRYTVSVKHHTYRREALDQFAEVTSKELPIRVAS